ncbi:C40 family peptidase [Lacticaseibacillus hegangensis]|uniref:NlpC/P60 family protein n=1 Tax=Lacticaseibacillus hegangensis TaxID=2486010 RepID=A0ABW4CSJ0_9LACO|nr:C40 family peptidase [Lacticaseibacillus hegangensis]
MKISKALSVIAVAALLSAGTLSTGTIVSADSVSDAKSAVSKNQSATAALVTKLQDAQANVSKINNQISDKVVSIQNTQDSIDAAETKIADYDGQIQKATAEVNSRKAVLKRQLVSLQKQVGDSVTGNVYMDFMLNAKNLSDLVSRGFTVNKLNQASQEALSAVQEAKAKVASLKSEQEAKRQQLVTSKATLVADKAKLETMKASATKQASDLSAQVEANKAQLTNLQSSVSKATAAAAAALVAQANAAKAQPQAAVVATSHHTAASAATTIASATPAAHYGSNMSGFVAAALAQRGKPYVWGAAGPSSFDCSGLVVYAAKLAGLGSLPHQASQLQQIGSPVSLSNLQPGDLLFWGAPAYHVAIYIGGGTFVHAPNPGQTVTTQSVGSWTPTNARRI